MSATDSSIVKAVHIARTVTLQPGIFYEIALSLPAQGITAMTISEGTPDAFTIHPGDTAIIRVVCRRQGEAPAAQTPRPSSPLAGEDATLRAAGEGRAEKEAASA